MLNNNLEKEVQELKKEVQELKKKINEIEVNKNNRYSGVGTVLSPLNDNGLPNPIGIKAREYFNTYF